MKVLHMEVQLGWTDLHDKCPHEAVFLPNEHSIRILPELCSHARQFLSLRKFFKIIKTC